MGASGRRHLTRRRVHTAHWTTSFRGVIPIDKAQTLPFHPRRTAEIRREAAPRDSERLGEACLSPLKQNHNTGFSKFHYNHSKKAARVGLIPSDRCVKIAP